MQLSKKFQRVLDTSVKVLKFVWRHAFTLSVFILLFAAFLVYPAIDWPMFCIELVIALCFDKIKMKWKFTSNYSRSCEQMFESTHRNMDSNSMDTTKVSNPAWNMNPFATGSSAYYTRTQTNYY